jgi:hypothetical protein
MSGDSAGTIRHDFERGTRNDDEANGSRGGCRARNQAIPPEMRAMEDDKQLTEMDDVEFLAQCREVRQATERTPVDELSEQTRINLARVEAEFLRRAGMAWQHVS